MNKAPSIVRHMPRSSSLVCASLLFLLFVGWVARPCLADPPAPHEERVVFKLKTAHEAPLQSASAIVDQVAKAIKGPTPVAIKRVFPNHEAPAEKVHPSGEPFADLSRIYEVVVAAGNDTEKIISSLLFSGMVEYAELAPVPYLLAQHDDESSAYIPNDSLLFTQYYLDNVRAYEAWGVSRGDTSTFVAIVDTGNDFFHPDLMQQVMYNYADPVNGEDSDGDGYVDNFYGWNLGEGNNFPQYRRHGHGVHVAGISSAMADNLIGIAGTGFQSRYLPVKVDDEHGRLVKAYEGIVYAADQGASVINCSWGNHFGGGRFGGDIIRYATLNRDALVVAGAGNAANALPFYPASYPYALGVAGTDSLDQKWSLSSYGLHVGLAAPGVRLLSTWPNNMYIRSSGTSMSAPIVAGAAALVRSHFPELTALQTKARLQSTADNIDTIPANHEFAGLMGAGRLNMYRALTDPFIPWMRIEGDHIDEDTYAAKRPGETMQVVLNYRNMLAPAGNMHARLIPLSPHFIAIEATTILGAVETLQMTNNTHMPFVLSIGEEVPANHYAPFFVEFYDHDSLPAGRQAFALIVNSDYLNVDNGKIITTITSKGAIGFNYPNYAQGAGLLVNRGYTQIKCGGLVLGDRQDRIADNIYSETVNTFSNTFHPKQNVFLEPEPLFSDIEVVSHFHTALSGGQEPGFDITQHTYFWRSFPRKDFFITAYTVKNITRQPQFFHAGFFVDWASRNSINMKVGYEPDWQVSYVNHDDQGLYAALQGLVDGELRHYAFDNDGHNGSIRINDGFQQEEKFLALTSERHQAGSLRIENDVASMISSGPHLLLPEQHLKLAYALHTAHDPETLKGQARLAAEAFSGISGEQPVGIEAATERTAYPHHAILAYPNPFANRLHIQIHPTQSNTTTIHLFNAQGFRVGSYELSKTDPANAQTVIDTSHLPPGLYTILAEGQGRSLRTKLLKIE